MSTSGKVVLRRTWPQRLVMLLCAAVIGAAITAAWFLDDFYVSVASIQRVQISRDVLRADTLPGEPVNFLLIGNDSALRLDPDDPVNIDRVYDPRGTFFADSITILRVDPVTEQAWVVSLPRDLLVDIPNGGVARINSALLTGGPELLVETVTANFGITLNHFVELDFFAFRQVVDQINGVPVWFDNPARDDGSGLNIPVPGCHVLDGVQALQYVRARKYEEFVDGAWVRVGNSDFGRIERQQDFFVLALDRAVSRGARNPTTLVSLIEAGAESVILDSELTVAELADLGEAFGDFNPENLQRFSPRVSTRFAADGGYLGEELIPEVNEEIFDVFRGAAGQLRPGDISFGLSAPDPSVIEQDGELLRGLGFVVEFTALVDTDETVSVIVHGPDHRAEAETVARYLFPIPALVEDADLSGLHVQLGRGHELISWIAPHTAAETVAAIEAHGEVEAPVVPEADAPSSTTSSSTSSSTSSTTSSTATTVRPAGSTTDAPPESSEAPRTIGRPPEGESCG